MTVRLFDVDLDWFDGMDFEQIDIEAESLESAAMKVWEKWRPTGWTHATVYDPESGLVVGVDLESDTPPKNSE